MNVEFWVNPEVAITDIKDSMEIESGTVIATLQDTITGTRVSLEVRGDVKIFYSPEGFTVSDGEYYTSPVEFPKGLKELIRAGQLSKDTEHVYVSDNNWFEIFTEYREEYKRGVYRYNYDVNTELCDPEGYTIPQLFDLLYDTLIQKEEEAAA